MPKPTARSMTLLAVGALVGSIGCAAGVFLSMGRGPPEPASLQDDVERAVLLDPLSADRRALLLSWLAELGRGPTRGWAEGRLRLGDGVVELPSSDPDPPAASER